MCSGFLHSFLQGWRIWDINDHIHDSYEIDVAVVFPYLKLPEVRQWTVFSRKTVLWLEQISEPLMVRGWKDILGVRCYRLALVLYSSLSTFCLLVLEADISFHLSILVCLCEWW